MTQKYPSDHGVCLSSAVAFCYPVDSEYGEDMAAPPAGCDPPSTDAKSAVLARVGRPGGWRRLHANGRAVRASVCQVSVGEPLLIFSEAAVDRVTETAFPARVVLRLEFHLGEFCW